MRQLKKLVILPLVFMFIFTLPITSFADSEINNIEPVTQLLNNYQEGINEKNENLYLSSFSQQYRNELKIAIENAKSVDADYLTKNIPFFSIDKIRFMNIEPLELYQVNKYYDLSKYEGKELLIYYTYFEAKIKQENETHYNKSGENFRLVFVIKDKDEWKIDEMATAPVELFVREGVTLNSKAEKTGAYISPNGIPVSEPGNIRVYLRSTLVYNGQTNYQYWGVSKNTSKSIPFRTYIKDVLPNEWDSDIIVPNSNYPSLNKINSLRAGALMVKTFSWYMVSHPWRPDLNADVNDDSSQMYLHDTVDKLSADGNGIKFTWGNLCRQAIDYYSDSAVLKNSDNTAAISFYTQTEQNYTYANNSKIVREIIRDIYGKNCDIYQY